MLAPLLHPWLRLALDRPELLADHASAYAALATAHAQDAVSQWRLRVLGWALLGIGAVLALGLAGVALMLQAMVASAPTPAATPAAWWWVPLMPTLLAAVGAWLALRAHSPGDNALAQQWKRDLAMLKERA
jgi:hypothetical protein